LNAQVDLESGLAPSLIVRSSVFEHNREAAIFVEGSAALIDATVVRDTQTPMLTAPRMGGRGLNAQLDPVNELRANITLRDSLVERSDGLGVFAGGADLVMERTLVRDTLERSDGTGGGRGLGVQHHPETRIPGAATVRWCTLERNGDVSLFVEGSHVVVEGTAVRHTRAVEAATGSGIGMVAVDGSGLSALLSVASCAVEHSEGLGIMVAGSTALIVATTVADTTPLPGDSSMGDGVVGLAGHGETFLDLRDLRVLDSARAGVSAFGANVRLQDTTIECAAFALNAETVDGVVSTFDDAGNNVCTCEGQSEDCQVLSSQLTAPEPPEPSAF
jgi:hypothetical protein